MVLADDADQDRVAGPGDVAHALPGVRAVEGQGQLDHGGLPLLELEDPHEVADADGLLHQGGHQPGGGDRHVHAPRLVEHPLVLGVVHAGDGARDAELGLGQQRDHEVGLVVTGRGHDHVALGQAGLVQGGDLAGVGEQPRRLGDAPGLDVVGVLVHEQHRVTVVQQLAGDGAPDAAGSGDDNTHEGWDLSLYRRYSAGGGWSSLYSTVARDEAAVTRCTRSPSW